MSPVVGVGLVAVLQAQACVAEWNEPGSATAPAPHAAPSEPGLQTSFALASVGSGLLSYGLTYRKQREGFGKAAQVRVVPQLSEPYSGLSLAGRF